MANPINYSAYTIYNSNKTPETDKNSEKYKTYLRQLRSGSPQDQEQYRKITGRSPTWEGRVVDCIASGEYTSQITTFFKGFFIATAMWLIKADGLPNTVKVGYVAFSLLFLFHDVMALCYRSYRDRHQD